MTNYTEPSGKADSSNETSGRPAWQAFSGRNVDVNNGSTFWHSSVSNAWLSYEWNNEVEIKKITFYKYIPSALKVQYKMNEEWIDAGELLSDGYTNNFIEKSILLSNTITTKSIRFISTSSTAIAIGNVKVFGINQSTMTLNIGETKTLITTNIGEENDTATWYSSDENIILVENGKVTGISSGTATITAVSGNEKAQCLVNISEYGELIPNMTSYTEPNGQVDSSNETSGRPAWQAFSGRTVNVSLGSTFWHSYASDAWLSYEWENEVEIKQITFYKYIPSSLKVQYKKNEEWIDVGEFSSDGNTDNFIRKSISLSDTITTKSIRFISTSNTAIAVGDVKILGK